MPPRPLPVPGAIIAGCRGGGATLLNDRRPISNDGTGLRVSRRAASIYAATASEDPTADGRATTTKFTQSDTLVHTPRVTDAVATYNCIG